MKTHQNKLRNVMVLALLALPLVAWAQDDDTAADDSKKTTAEKSQLEMEFTAGLYYLDDDSYRFGKFSGLTDDGVEALADFRIEKRPEWNSGDGQRWRLQGWRLGLDSRRIELDFNDLGTQRFKADYREIPNNRFSDGSTPYRGIGSSNLTLPPDWAIAPGNNNTSGFLTLDESLTNLKIDTKRKRLDLSYDRKLSRQWSLNIDYRHETKKGERTIGSIFGTTGGNPRSVILPAPVDYQTDNIEAMFEYANTRMQFGFGAYGSFFNNDETSLVWQNAFGNVGGWAPSVSFPGSQGALALKPDNSYIQFKAYAGLNLAGNTRITADVALGEMEQDDPFLPFTINPNLIVNTPVPLENLDGKIDTTQINLRLTSQLARRLNVAINYRYDDRDNKTPREVFPYISADSQNQRAFEDGRLNLPYSYREHKADATLTYRLPGNTRLKGGVEYSDYSRDFSEVADADQFTWLLGLKVGAFQTASLSFDYRKSSRDVSAYIGNLPLIESRLPGTVEEDEFENHPLLRKYYLTDRSRNEFRFRSDFFPIAQVNFGFSASYFKDDYDDGFFGLNQAKIRSGSIDFGWYPVENISLVAYYTKEKYDAEQSNRAFGSLTQANDPKRNWFADTTDRVDTWNVTLAFSDIGSNQGWKGFDLGFDYTYSDTESQIDVTSPTLATAPLPELRSKLRSVSAWATIDVGSHSSIRLGLENSLLNTDDFALDNVLPDTLTNVLTLGESAANYDVILITGSWTYRF